MSFAIRSLAVTLCVHSECCMYTSLIFFFFATATTDIYTLSLHDALPICQLPLKGLHLGTQDVAAPVDHGGDPLLDRRSQRLQRCLGVEQRNGHEGEETLIANPETPRCSVRLATCPSSSPP